MASIIEDKKGYRVYLCVKGYRCSKRTKTLYEATKWATQKEKALLKASKLKDPEALKSVKWTLGEVFHRYSEEVSEYKKGARWEIIRLDFFKRKFPKLCKTKLVELTHEDIQDWIDFRVQQVQPSTVNRELNLISHCLTKARKWRLMKHKPFDHIERPRNPEHRDRRIENNEILALCHILNYKANEPIKEKRQFLALAWLFSIETCMRRGEISNLTQSNIDITKKIAFLPDTKNGSSRKVPLSPRAIEILNQLPKPKKEENPLFQLSADSISTLFRRYRERASIKDMVFHDARHEGITRLVDSGKFNVFEVSLITGHKNINELLTYYNKSAFQMAEEMAINCDTKKSSTSSMIFEKEELTQLIREIITEQKQLSKQAID